MTTVKPITSIAVCKYCCVAMFMGTVEWTFNKLVLGSAADRDLLQHLDSVIRQELIKIKAAVSVLMRIIDR